MTKERLKQMSVLFVEDEELPRIAIGKLLKRRVGSLHVGSNGREGLELFMAKRPDIVIADLELPVLSGTEMIHRILEVDETVPVIVTTGYDDDDHRTRMACRTLIKPIIFDDLLKAIYDALANSPKKVPSPLAGEG